MSTATVQQAFALALHHHQAGRLADAETLYRQILAVQPNHFDALHLLGVIAYQVGRHELAVQLIRQAITLNPNDSVSHSNLGETQRALGWLDKSIASFYRAIELNPDSCEAHCNLGNALRERGRPDEAVTACRRALELRPDFTVAHIKLGNALHDRGRHEEAIAAYRRALELQPDRAETHNNLGNAFRSGGQLDEAIAAYQRALELQPDLAEAHHNLGNTFKDRGRLDEAITAYCKVLELQPDGAKVHNNLAVAFHARGQLVEAIATYGRAIELQPDLAEAHNNVAIAFRERGQLEEATAACQRALELQPDFAEAHNNLGNAFKDKGRLDEAIAAYRRALELKPGYAEAHNNLGNAFKDQGDLPAAILAFRQALQWKPERAATHSNLVYSLHFLAEEDAGQILAEQRRWNARFGESAKRFFQPHTNDRNSERRLRIGYVSPDFWHHVVALNLIPLFKFHDRRDFEILCYSGVKQPDESTVEFQRRAERWRNTTGVGDEALAEMIRGDGIDILVDLSQHMAGNRLPTFARQPAPVQVSFAGYPESTGVEAIEYRISDRWLELEIGDGRWEIGWKCEPDHQPERVFLIDSFWCYEPCGTDTEINELAARENGWITFGSLNNFCKVNEPLLRLWARVLKLVKESRLVLLSGLGSHRQRTLEFLEREGVAPRRVEFVEPRPRRAYLELCHRLDIVLDTFPYNGHTTSLDALWMGVPVISLAGKHPVSRAGLSQLSNLGLPELVAHSENEYVEIAASLAHDHARVAELRRTLRSRMEASVLMDRERFARNIETAYRAMWRQWCLEGTG